MKNCELESLLEMVNKERPKWGSSCGPCFDLTGALERAGFPFSISGPIKVLIEYNALLKLTGIFYSNKPPKLNTDCKFKSLTDSQKSTELQSLIELSSLAQYWCWEEIAEEVTNSVVDCIARNSVDERGCLRAIGFAKELGQWGIVEGGVRWLAPKYPKLRGGGIEGLGRRLWRC